MVFTLNPKFIAAMSWYYSFSTLKRSYSYVIVSLMMPLTILFIVYIISHGAIIEYAVLGGFIIMIASNSLSSAGDAAFMRLQLRIQDLFVDTSITPMDYMLALTISYAAFALPGLAIFAVMGIVLKMFTILNVLLLIAILIMLLVSSSAISFIISSRVKHVRNVWGISAIISTLLTMIPPTFYPYTYLPKIALYILALSPATPAAVLAQGYFGLAPKMLSMLGVLMAEVVIYMVIARYFVRWRES